MSSSLLISILSLLNVFVLSSSKIIHNMDEYLFKAPVINLTADGSETILFVRLCEWSSMDGHTTILNMTRYCYCQESKEDDPTDDSCSVPGPTLIMHDYTSINVTVINEVIGSNISYNESSQHWNKYKDQDLTNLHVHGLHVSPEVDDVLIKIFPNQNSHSYPYNISYHYPGTFWYHAHHHGSTTWQVNMGLHGTILMEQDGDNTSMIYEENVLMFEWFYVIPSWICNPGMIRTCNGSDTKDNKDALYSPRFQTYSAVSTTRFNGSNYAMCDIYCSFPYLQREESGYVYDVKTQLYLDPDNLDTVDPELLLFFVNGQLSPKIAMTTGVFRRLRMINSLSNWYLQFQFPFECQWHLIATDGVYIGGEYMNYNLSKKSHNNQYIMAPGGRADFLVKCGASGTYEIKSTNDNTQDPDNLRNIPERAYPDKILFKLEVTDGLIPNGTDKLPNTTVTKVNRTYIEDLSGLTHGSPDFETECGCNYNDSSNKECEIYFSFPHGGAVNNKSFGISSVSYPHKSDALMLIKQQKAYEFIIDNNANSFKVAHVYHQHINPFQVQTPIGKNGFIALKNTWWDTLGNNPNNTESNYIRMRFWTRNYPGLVIVHCHLLQHEDAGMMGFYVILNKTEEIPKTCPNPVTIDVVTNQTRTTTEPTPDVTTSFYTTPDDDEEHAVRDRYLVSFIITATFIVMSC